MCEVSVLRDFVVGSMFQYVSFHSCTVLIQSGLYLFIFDNGCASYNE